MTAPERDCVLVVDDDPDVRQLYARYLEGDYRVLTAPSGEAALRTFDDEVDVVLLDRRLPDLSGADVHRRLRADGYDQPAAMVTSVEPDVDILEMGFDDYVVKPVEWSQLADLVETLRRRGEYDGRMREYAALASTMAALERRRSAAELETSRAYVAAARRLEALADQDLDAVDSAADVGAFDAPSGDARLRRRDPAPRPS